MTSDGRFSLERELRRFLDRCPKLKSVRHFDYLLEKGVSVSEEEVVHAVAELLLLPNYTIPLLGCFRPIAQKIVERTVGLLHLSPNLRSDNDNCMEEEEEFNEDGFLKEVDVDGAEGYDVINVYTRRGRGLRLHELACLAFCRALDLMPFLLGSILKYFEVAPAPFKRILQCDSLSESLSVEAKKLLDAVRPSYRFLILEPEVFSKLWDWSCFLDLVHEFANTTLQKDSEQREIISDLSWCSVGILSVVLRLSFKAPENSLLDSEESLGSYLRWQEFCTDVSIEKGGWYVASSVDEMEKTDGRNDIPKGHYLKHSRNLGNPFILTSAMRKSFEMVSLAVSQRWPVLLYGPSGAGKTALLDNIAVNHSRKVLSIQMDEQIDGKTLTGSYVCTERPGEFRWQPGSLTQAVRHGFWVVFENVDKASPDVLAILLPLLEGATTFSTGQGEAIRVNEGFRLFSTMTSTNEDIFHLTEGRSSLGAFWRKVMICRPSKEDLLNIVQECYPALEFIAEKLIETLECVNQLIKNQVGLAASSDHHEKFTLRDLLKLCKRIASYGFLFFHDGLSSNMLRSIYEEAMDVFASFYCSTKNRLEIMREIAKIWSISPPETLYPVNKPIIKELQSALEVGRVRFQHDAATSPIHDKPFVELRSSVHALERIACSVKFNEPVLLVGETGTGKTTLVQTLARKLGQKLVVLNLSQQSDIADLLGGFRPEDARFVFTPIYNEFRHLCTEAFPSKENERFLVDLDKTFSDKNWNRLLRMVRKTISLMAKIGKASPGTKRKRKREELLISFENFSMKVERAFAQVNTSDGMVFSFVEGAVVTSLKHGDWILLDEINLAPPEVLQRIIGVLEGDKGSLCLAERGDIDYVSRHPNFRIFACMNPATDASKRNLPFSLRSRFTEYFVDDGLDDEDLVLFIKKFVDERSGLINKIVQFYKSAKESEERMQDGANQRPHYSLRSLYRSLEYFKMAGGPYGSEKSLYDAFCMFFLNLLDESSGKLMNNLICKYLLEGKAPPKDPFDPFLISETDDVLESYILTQSVKKHLANLTRATSIGKYPVLLQGHTSSGKTSLVRFLAARNGHEFTRINNHENTDIQEYLGSYITDKSGKLVFQEGALVKAVRKGHWIVLDELNLAPSDVLEALNRLLDDNRELFVPELHETIRAHPNFMLFATQNPPHVYGGRKMLSRAFRNRFVEMHVDEIPQEELNIILEKRCKIPGSYAGKMVDVMKELQLHRQGSKVFAGKHGFMTPRDLFRWADRFRKFGKSYEDLACDGYYLIAERLRDDAEKRIVKEVLERRLKVKITEDLLYKIEDGNDGNIAPGANKSSEDHETTGKIIWTKSMWRMYFLVERCYKMREPVLLVGETGGGKTTVCQLLSVMLGSRIHVLNCHQYTETSDFLGGFYPVRERSKLAAAFQNLCDRVKESKVYKYFSGDKDFCSDIDQASRILLILTEIIKSYRQYSVYHPEVSGEEIEYIEKLCEDIRRLQQNWQTIFEWHDGPLVEAMKNGDLFLVDEISLAADGVLERLNSVLEPERKLTLAEKGGFNLESIIAHPDFFILATMNPGGDYGKKELSPALRNRFVEIWVPSVTEIDELRSIAHQRILEPKNAAVVDIMLYFWKWFDHLQTGRILTVRDLLSWVSFINVTGRNLPAESALLHGAFLVLLDGLSLGTNISKHHAADLRVECFDLLLKRIKDCRKCLSPSCPDNIETYGWSDPRSSTVLRNNKEGTNYADNPEGDHLFGIDPFYIEIGANHIDPVGFEFLAPTTRRNTLRVLRAMQLYKPVLLEGSPGVGKTSLVAALGRSSGHTVVRINLSEQTDIMDLLGSDLPVETDESIRFAWADGILLQALKKGSWVLLDELNLAPQSVLEGLNAILDHRGEVFIPELGRSFKCPTTFRVFACQNPSYEGGGRKGLPKSFLNRFTKVYVDELDDEDYLSICSSLFPSIEISLLKKLVEFNKRLHQNIMLFHKFGYDGSPWEFNLRDMIRSCQLIQVASKDSKPDCFLSPIYLQRMRTANDRSEIMKLYGQIFQLKPSINPYPRVQLNPCSLVVGNVSIERHHYQPSNISKSELKILPDVRNCLEAMGQCIKHNWLCILVGPPSSGKTSLIRLVASLTGNVLNEVNLSSSSDISELLGCFEQYNASRHFHLAIVKIERYVNEYIQLESFSEAFLQRKELIKRWLAFLSSMNNGPSASSSATFLDNPSMIDSIPQLVEVIQLLKENVQAQSLAVSWSVEDLESTLNTIKKLEEDHQKKLNPVKFEWVTGVLVKAIENGEWIVLENANLCNPTVLDRINSLVEHSGSITINECGTVDGKPVVLYPHPKFRMFLTVNPSYGEVSRAMRNRGVEIYLMPPHWLVNEMYGEHPDALELRDVKRSIALSGIPVGKLVDMMAKAHMYAKQRGPLHNVTITYLELSRWLQLFQQLIASGNHPAWSIQISWEHTYLSSFGEGKGKDIVSQAAVSYLSMPKLYGFSSSEDCLLCLSGGWPSPLRLRDHIFYSKEACVRQNCMYVESLGSLIASHTFSRSMSRCQSGQNFLAGATRRIHLINAKLLHRLVFPKVSTEMLGYHVFDSDMEMVSAQKKLLCAIDWVLEQASQSDYRLYIQWFEWFHSQLKLDSQSQPLVPFLEGFVDVLKEELQHPIWTRIFSLRHDLISRTGRDFTTLPLLSMELSDVCQSNGLQNFCCVLMNSIKCVCFLRRSLIQWNIEMGHSHSPGTQKFAPVLTSLQMLEKKMLGLLVELPNFDVRLKEYIDLLEHHVLFWNYIILNQVQGQRIYGRILLKDATKLKDVCPVEVEEFQIKMKHLDILSSLCLDSQISLLWRNGGHPILPSSVELYQKQCQILDLCKMVWPRKNKFLKPEVDHLSDVYVQAAVSTNAELRRLAMQGVCKSSYEIGKADDDSETIQKSEEMCQRLLATWLSEKHQLSNEFKRVERREMNMGTTRISSRPDVFGRIPAFVFWLMSGPTIDETSLLLDLGLLCDLTKNVACGGEQHHALLELSGHLESALSFSLDYSSRLPTDFVPHQKILWTVDAWTKVDRGTEKISCYILEMWYRWHATLWETCSASVVNFLNYDSQDVLLPHKIFSPLRLVMVDQILRSTDSVGDYESHSLKLQAALRNIWYCSQDMINLDDMLLFAAQSLFQQIIYAHKKSFEDSIYVRIVSAFGCIKELRNRPEIMEDLISCLASSNHRTFVTLVSSYIKPLLKELYPLGSSDDALWSLGCAFLRIGAMRYSLLINCNDLDPAAKYAFKYSEVTDKISSIETEIQVRNECAYLAGSIYPGVADHYRISLLENLRSERRKLQSKMVFRPNPGNLKELMRECDEFLGLITIFCDWMKDIESMLIDQVTDKVRGWQESMSRFIDRLSNEYAAYPDIIEPVLVAVYELKLGLSLIVSSFKYKKCTANGELHMETVLPTLYTFMRFPRGCASKTVLLNVTWESKLSTSNIELPSCVEELNMDLLLDMTNLIRENANDPVASKSLQKISVYHNLLARMKESVSNTHFLSDSSFKLLHGIFDDIVSLWMKHRATATETNEAQAFMFRARVFKLERIMDIDVSNCANFLANDSFLEWQGLLHEEFDENMRANSVDEALEHDWEAGEPILDDIVNIHNQLFGSLDLSQRPGSFQVSEMDRITSFLDSYTLGVKITRDLRGLFSSSFDAKLAPEHLFRLCLEHNHKFIFSQRPTGGEYNFYKDPNSNISKLVEPVRHLKSHILSLQERNEAEGRDQIDIAKISKIVDMILSLPLDTPLAKVLSALEFLVNKFQKIGKKSLSGELQPIFVLMASWYKLEFESWPAMLDEVQSQFDKNAGKLWFPLYSIFLRNRTADIGSFNNSTIESLEDFFKTSSIGEFKKQLQLLLSILGQINSGLSRRFYTSPCQVESGNILYNTFGFYVPLLSRILEHIDTCRRSIEKDLKDLYSLSQTNIRDVSEAKFSAIENLQRSRVKLRKIVKKYSDALAEPLMEFLGREASRSAINTQCIQGSKPMIKPFDVSKTLLVTIYNQIQSIDSDSRIWFVDWWKSLDGLGGFMNGIKDSVPSSSCLLHWEEKKQAWHTIEKLCTSLIHCNELWGDRSKKLGKRRALSDLLNLLDSCGLSKHRSFIEGEFYTSRTWLQQPSYEIQHLLLAESDCFSTNVNVGFSRQQSSSDEVLWKTANKYYFKSIASIKYLEKICLKFHKDFTLVQVKRSGSYTDHLIEIQQGQRDVAHYVAKQIKCLRESTWPLSNLFSSIDLACETRNDCSFIKNQHVIFNCMWQQKQLLDGFCSVLFEERLLLQTIGNNLPDTCSSVHEGIEKVWLLPQSIEKNLLYDCSIIKLGLAKICQFIEKALPNFEKSKDLLDNFLLGSIENVTVEGISLHPFGVTKEMEQLVNQNFELIRTFQKDVSVFKEEDRGIAKFMLLGHFNELFLKAEESENLYYSLQSKRLLNNVDGNPEETIHEFKCAFETALKETHEHILGIFRRIGTLEYEFVPIGESLKDIKAWKVLFERDAAQLQLDLISEDVLRTVQSAGELLNCCGNKNPHVSSAVCMQLRHLYAVLIKILAFGDNLLQEFLVLQNMVSAVSHVLATTFASLFTQGFGTVEDEEDENVKETTKDASGTGMGEGAGLNDVSDQINNEDQLLGTSEQQNERGDDMPDLASKNEKGIEMDEEFDGKTSSISGDSEDDESEDSQEEQLESTMGDAGANSEIVDEKHGDLEDEDNSSTNEKYEHGPAVKNKASQDEELRSAEDSTGVNEDVGNLDREESQEQNGETGNEDDSDGTEDKDVEMADMVLDPPSTIPEDQNQMPEGETQVDKMEAEEPFEDGESENSDGSDFGNNEKPDLVDELMDDEDSKHFTDNTEATDPEEDFPENNNTEKLSCPAKNTPSLAPSTGQPKESSDAADTGNVGLDEMNSNLNECDDGFAPTSNLPNASQLEDGAAASVNGKRFRDELSRTSLRPPQPLTQKAWPNSRRGLGNALDGWKESVKVSVDLQDQTTNSNDMVDENADEYGYTAEFEEGTAQALGPATADQITEDIVQNETDMEMVNSDARDPTAESEIDKQASENCPIRTVKDGQIQNNMPDLEKQPKEFMEIDVDYDQNPASLSESLVSVSKSYMNEDMYQPSKCSLSDNELGKFHIFEPPAGARNDAAARWRRYEQLVIRLSQELAEQLRLIMEPTVASKLQGDYKTGKRINMKKVIPYVASHFQKDKIWLRRTRPGKCDYQVLIAVDDSRSMSEGNCGDPATAALVTVCRAMSQLEVGSLAVASFGKQGNIRLLHDFYQPFTPEAENNMISSLTFEQENTIADEPMVDLLKYVNTTLDSAVMHAQLPSGNNPLQQLVLIIADGRLSEKEKLKRYVRDSLSKKRMVAFLILDSGRQSIVDLEEATVQGMVVKRCKYLDSFPFPYYVVLKNIEALPRMLADLLRQWFELMQYSRE